MPNRYVLFIGRRIGEWAGALQARAALALAAAFQSCPRPLDEAYIAQATNVYDVDLRIRELERRRAGLPY